jgi:putative ABC transport system permease protein
MLHHLRALLRVPAFTAIAVISLALGIGANSALFALVDAVLLRPLPHPEPDQLVTLRGQHSVPDVRDMLGLVSAFAGGGAYASWAFDLAGGAEPERASGSLVTGEVLPALAVKPLLGRLITADDERGTESAEAVAVISERLWRTRFAGRADVVGSPVQLSGKSYLIVGVLPASFRLPLSESEILVPFAVAYPEGAQARGAHFTLPVFRLRTGVSLEAAQAQVDAAGRRMAELHPDEDQRRYALIPLRERLSGPVRLPLVLLLGAVVLVLLVACANFANLLLARGIARQRELAVRAALGASRWRLVRGQLAESLLLAGAGGAFALLLAHWILPGVVALAPAALPVEAAPAIDGRTMAVNAAVALLTGLVFGLIPAWQASRVDLHLSLKSSGGGAGPRARFRQALVGAELLISVLLLVGAGLLLRSLSTLQRAPLGFDPRGVVGMRLSLPVARYPAAADSTAFFVRALEAVERVPGVRDAALVSEAPLSGASMGHDILFEGEPEPPVGKEPDASVRTVSGGYFAQLGIPLVQGRTFTRDDVAGSTPVIAVNQAFVRTYLAGTEPLGRRLRWARGRGAESKWLTIVGVVGDERHQSIERPSEPTIYLPFTQNEMPWKRWSVLLVRPHGEVTAFLAQDLRRAVWSADPLLPVELPTPLARNVAGATASRRFSLVLLGLFAGVALLLAAIGVYGVVSYQVGRRTRELGVRMALGASPRSVLVLVLGEMTRIAAPAALLGIGVALGLARLLRAMLYGVAPSDPLTYLAAGAILFTLALIAALGPARRAMRIDPAVALRED